MLLSRAAAAGARSLSGSNDGRALTPAILKEEYRVRRRSPDRHRFDAKRADLGAHHLYTKLVYAAQLGTADMNRAVLLAAVLAAASSFAPVAVWRANN